MRVVLVNPPPGVASGFRPSIDCRPNLFPPGILSLAASCEAAGHRTEILDLPLLGWGLRDFEAWVEGALPDVVGLSFCSCSLPYVGALADATRRLSPRTTLVAGGSHATFAAEDVLRAGIADYVVSYEGDRSFVDLLQDLSDGRSSIRARGVCFLAGDRLAVTQPASFVADLDELPVPAYHLLDMDAYRRRLGRAAVHTLRGCPFGCTFCSISRLMGSKVRVRSPDLVVEELMRVVRQYGIDRISITDPNFVLSRQRLEQLAARFEEAHLEFRFGCQSRLLTLTDDILALLRRMGCVSIFVGVESGSRRILSGYDRHHEIEQGIDAYGRIARIREFGIDVIPSFIVGSPDETPEDVDKTLDLARRIIRGLDLDHQSEAGGGNYHINVFGPFPGVGVPDVPLELPIHYSPSMPVCGTRHVTRAEVKSRWHGVYREYHPEYLEPYLALERAAECGVDLYFQRFLGSNPPGAPGSAMGNLELWQDRPRGALGIRGIEPPMSQRK